MRLAVAVQMQAIQACLAPGRSWCKQGSSTRMSSQAPPQQGHASHRLTSRVAFRLRARALLQMRRGRMWRSLGATHGPRVTAGSGPNKPTH